MSEAQVYVPDADAAWARASVLSKTGDTVYEVRIDGIDDNNEGGTSDWGAGEVRRVDLAGPEFGVRSKGAAVESSLPLQNLGVSENGVEDMTRLDYLHEPAILFNLRRRFFRALPYTYTGEIVIACNPYQWLDLYGEERRKQYAGMVRGERSRLPPHVYSTSAVAFAGLSKDRENQSILVSGESGAGKTETVKILMGHLAVASSAGREEEGGAGGRGDGKRENEDVIRKIIESNPLLESFGNAQTTRNDNSSRFGKFTQLQFDGGFRMSGSGCTTYLLEKSRVVGHEAGERAYHVFYQILAAPEAAKEALGLAGKLALDFRYLTADGKEADSVIEGRTDAQRYEMTTAALGLIGVSEEETLALFRALAGVLFLGQVDFSKRGGDDDKSEVVDRDSLLPPSALLGLDSQAAPAPAPAPGGGEALAPGAALDSSLCYRTIRARNDVLRADSSPAQAADARDAMAKAIYGGLFEWLVQRINRSTASSAGSDGADKRRHAGEALAPGGTVALLDIFGFESFKVNRFEQLCINYANEKLQQKFTQDVFKNVQVEYEEEGIPWSHVDFSDNAEVLGLVESRMGIIAVLNEECVRPRGGDLSFVSKLATLHADHSAFSRAKLAGPFEFSVRHYAGEVLYHAEGFLDKNRDSVGEACQDLLAKSSVPLIAKIFAPYPSSAEGEGGEGASGALQRKKSSMATNTLATKFKGSLTTLMETIGLTSVQYVRCIKPNAAKLPGRMENAKVAEQLRCAGVVEAIRISRAAYPNRMTRTDFNRRFALLGSSLHRGDGEMVVSKSLLGKLLPREGGEDVPLRYEMGRSKVFFRKGALEHLESLRLAERSSRAVVLQAVLRMYPRKMKYRRLKAGALRAQAEWRRVSERRRFLTARGQVIRAQTCWRRVKAAKVVLGMRRHNAASCLQAYQRMVVARRRFVTMKDAAVAVQTCVRGAQARRNFAILVVEHREAAKLENQILALQRKLEEEREARLEMEAAHKQYALKAEAAAAAKQQSASSPRPSLELPGLLPSEEAAKIAALARGGDSSADGGGGGVLDMIGDAPKLSTIPGRLGDEPKSSPTGSTGTGATVAAAAAAGAGSFVKGAMEFFSPTSMARQKKFEDERREASLDIMGESSQIIGALKAEVDKLRKENVNLKKSNESLRRERQYDKQKALNTYEASGMSYHALNQTVKALSLSKQKLTAEVMQQQTAHAEDRVAMLEIIQSKGEELLRREEEGKTMRLLYESEVTKGKNRQQKMEAMLRLLAETSAPIEDSEKDELLHHMSSMYKECVLEDPNVVDEVDNMMSSIGMGRVSAKATSALFSAKAWFTGKKQTDLFI
ncbi:unnamed protein product [Pylaiella littoralis]